MQEDWANQQLPMATKAGDPPAAAVRVPRPLSARAKAAIVVRLLLNEGADLPLEELPEDLQARLTQQMGAMKLVDRITLGAVVDEFVDALDGIGLSFPHGLAGALSALDGKISPQTAARLRKEAGVRQAGDPWARLRALDVADLATMAEAESVEVAAVLLSKLDTAKAASLLGRLPGPLARKITYAVAQTGNVTPDAVDRIGLSLAGQLDQKPVLAFDRAPGERVGAILNQSAAAKRDEMLSALEETDAEFATRVRRAIFTFAHIPHRLAPRDAAKVIRAADPGDLLTAIAGATGADDANAASFLLANISARMADNLREEAAEKGAVKQRDAEAAMNAIVNTIRALEQSGDLELIPAEDTEGDG